MSLPAKSYGMRAMLLRAHSATRERQVELLAAYDALAEQHRYAIGRYLALPWWAFVRRARAWNEARELMDQMRTTRARIRELHERCNTLAHEAARMRHAEAVSA